MPVNLRLAKFHVPMIKQLSYRLLPGLGAPGAEDRLRQQVRVEIHRLTTLRAKFQIFLETKQYHV